MPQALLPLIPDGATPINDRISVARQDGQWIYFCGIAPVFQHAEDDHRSFRMFTAQLCCQDACKQAEVIRTFGVSKNSVLRSVKKYQEEGNAGFFQPRRGRGPSIITEKVVAEAERLLALGYDRRQTAQALNVPYETLRKAIQQGRVREPGAAEQTSPSSPASPAAAAVTDKSTRSDADAAAGEAMGIACTRPCERVMAALGRLPEGAPIEFESCRDVSYGGVLCALPALAENGLFDHLQALPVLSGLYAKLHVIVLLAYMVLCRFRAVERLQNESPGELGKLMGLDRVPEVRCLRMKIAQLSRDDAAAVWAGVLSKRWMDQKPEWAGTLYVDGHVRLYHGKKTKLPRRYVSRQRLCLRKHPQGIWPESEFTETKIMLPGGEYPERAGEVDRQTSDMGRSARGTQV